MTVLVIGGSVAGLASALAFNQQGHDVHILERDGQEPPATIEAANDSWSRPTVPQAVHSHAFASLGRNLVAERAPEVYQALLAAGTAEVELAAAPPPSLQGFQREPEDDQLRMLACRRATFEWVLRREVLARPGVKVETGTTARSLEFAGRRAVGVRTDDGRLLAADTIIDAGGRRSSVSQMAADQNLPVPDRQSDSCEIVYYTRYYRRLSPRPGGPLNRGFGAGGLWNHYTAVLFLGDNNTFSISIGVLPGSGPMKALRHEDVFTAAIRATPLLAGWLDPGVSEPISPVYAMGGLDNTFARPGDVAGTGPLGLFGVGDSVCTTNPAYGRGVSLALAHAYGLADVLAAHPDVDDAQAGAAAELADRLFTPWWKDAVDNDRGRARLWRATVEGVTLPPPPPQAPLNFGAVVAASATDATVWRKVARTMMMLAEPASLYQDPDVGMRVGRALAGGPPPSLPGASYAELVALVSAAPVS
jgi:2-polyprenyl-6-methoxyphenol hydroxylase-like FAD-dependent oxidoreductase